MLPAPDPGPDVGSGEAQKKDAKRVIDVFLPQGSPIAKTDQTIAHVEATVRAVSRKTYVDGEWVDPIEPKPFDVINPATEDVIGRISLGSAADVDRAVAAARRAFDTYTRTSTAERLPPRCVASHRVVEAMEEHSVLFLGALHLEMDEWLPGLKAQYNAVELQLRQLAKHLALLVQPP